MFSECLGDGGFGPAVHGCRSDFDFTIKFELIVFSLLCTSIFIAISALRIVHLRTKPVIVATSSWKSAKLATTSIYIAVQVFLLVLSGRGSGNLKALFVASSAVTLISGLFMLVLAAQEHSRSPRPSILLTVYLSLRLLFDTTQTRTLWIAATNSSERAFASVNTAAVAILALLVLLECRHKSKQLMWPDKSYSPEEINGFYGLGGFLWLNSLLLLGYRKILDVTDLYPLDQNVASETLHQRFANRLLVAASFGGKHGLFKALIRVFAVPLLLPVAPRIALAGFSLSQPLFLTALLNYLQAAPGTAPANYGYGLIGAAIFIYAGIAVFNALYQYFQERALFMIRGCLDVAIYKKTTEANSSAAENSAALTLMSGDVEYIRIGLLGLHEFWANAIEIAVAAFLLERNVGAAFVAPLVVTLLCVLGASFLIGHTGPRQAGWMVKVQTRIASTANAIRQMKHIKISGLVSPLYHVFQQLRIDEIKAGNEFRMAILLALALGFIPGNLSPVLTFAITRDTLTITTIYTSISYLLLLTTPLTILSQTFTLLLAALASLDRIQTFLELEPRDDYRELQVGGPSGAEKPAKRAVVEISNGSFGWSAENTQLRDINLSILQNSLTMIIGPVASGKSTLCKALLGEVPFAQGRINITTEALRIGYCDQVPCLTNTSVKKNITGPAPFDPVRYREVIKATILQPDLDMLPQGDDAIVGSDGSSLSGGQKQRIAMARALYLDSSFLIFDDTMSSLDADVEEKVLLSVFGPHSCLRQRGATAVLCTHSIRHLHLADHIVALGEDGTVVEQGTFEYLMRKEGYLSGLKIKLGAEEIAESGVEHVVGPVFGDAIAPPFEDSTSQTLKGASFDIKMEGRVAGEVAVYKHYFNSITWFPKIGLFVISLSIGFFNSWQNIWLNYWATDVTSAHPVRSAAFYIGLYALFQAMSLLLILLLFFIGLTRIVMTSGSRLHEAAIRTVLAAPLAFFSSTDTGIITNLFSQDMTLVDGELPIALLNILMEMANCIGIAAVIATSSAWLVISYPLVLGVLYLVQKFYLRTSRQLRLLDLETKSPLYSQFIDTINNIVTLRAFRWTDDGVQQNNRALDRSQQAAYLFAMAQQWLALTLNMIVAVMATLIVILATQGHSSTGFTGASLVSIMSLGASLGSLIRRYTMLETSIGAVARIKRFSEVVKPEEQEGEDFNPPEQWPTGGSIQINGVSASYDTSNELSAPNLVLRDIHLSIAVGERVAVCGRSGSGKSSLALLLLKLLDPLPSSRNKIAIDGTPLHTINRTALRERIIAISQDPVLLPDSASIRKVLDPFTIATDAACRAALETVQLWPAIVTMGGLDAALNADNFSQGQKQLFALARAVLRRRVRAENIKASSDGALDSDEVDGGLLVLDEVTSSVDRDTEQLMRQAIDAEFKNWTTLMVGHRLEMVMDYDRVIVMDKGCIVEMGPPKTLIEKEGGYFRNLCIAGGSDHVNGQRTPLE
ncbi:ATPase-like protein [Diaporthe sp. PMI_573]|nr:ATPase-like protein [Diaporthaceae sp. PMI_573]